MSNPLKQAYEVFGPSFIYDPVLREHRLDMEKKRKALVTILINAQDTEDARMLMEILGYLPHKTFARINNRVVATSEKSQTNGFLESIGRL